MKDREKKLISIEIFLLIVELILALFGNFIYQRIMTEGARIIVRKYSFISAMTWGYGNFFPILYIVHIFMLAGLMGFSYMTSNHKEDKLSSNILAFGGLVFLVLPLIIRLQKINPGLIIMVLGQIIILIVNIIRTKTTL